MPCGLWMVGSGQWTVDSGLCFMGVVLSGSETLKVI